MFLKLTKRSFIEIISYSGGPRNIAFYLRLGGGP